MRVSLSVLFALVVCATPVARADEFETRQLAEAIAKHYRRQAKIPRDEERIRRSANRILRRIADLDKEDVMEALRRAGNPFPIWERGRAPQAARDSVRKHLAEWADIFDRAGGKQTLIKNFHADNLEVFGGAADLIFSEVIKSDQRYRDRESVKKFLRGLLREPLGSEKSSLGLDLVAKYGDELAESGVVKIAVRRLHREAQAAMQEGRTPEALRNYFLRTLPALMKVDSSDLSYTERAAWELSHGVNGINKLTNMAKFFKYDDAKELERAKWIFDHPHWKVKFGSRPHYLTALAQALPERERLAFLSDVTLRMAGTYLNPAGASEPDRDLAVDYKASMSALTDALITTPKADRALGERLNAIADDPLLTARERDAFRAAAIRHGGYTRPDTFAPTAYLAKLKKVATETGDAELAAAVRPGGSACNYRRTAGEG